ncbi:MAG: oligopeptide transporter, OPT family [bacterium]|nr:oligopeptide transporter, OPT family [bacterium]
MSDQQPALPEITFRVIVLGILLSIVMGAANVYVGLKAGMTVSASIPAAVVAMIIFKGILKQSSILEANQVQTCASAGESLAAGIIFTMPALLLIGFWTEFDFWTVTAVAFSGGLLGILFMIPMRRVFVVDNDELPFPEGVACAAVLEAGEENEDSASAAKALVFGGLLGAGFKFLADFVGVFVGTLEGAVARGQRIFYFGGDLSPMLVAVGLIVRLNVAILIFIGGALGWLIGIPLLGRAGEFEKPLDGAWDLWGHEIRYVGVGAMVVGGIASIFAVRKGLVEAVRELAGARSKVDADGQSRDLGTGVIAALATLCIAIAGFVYYKFTGALAITVASTIAMLVMAFFFTAVASYIVGLVGNSNSPVSGMTITAVLFTGGMLHVMGFTGMQFMVSTLGVAAIVCCVACTSGDVCNDLKTGSMVGATPFRQQIMQVIGVLCASLVMAPVLQLLHDQTDGGIGGKNLSAPQASLFANLARGFAGEIDLPWDMIRIGAGVGIVILVIDAMLKSSGSKFRAYLMPIAVGMYLPFGLATPILIGGLMAHFITRGCATPAEEDKRMHKGVLFGSGVIAGEALMGVALAGIAALEVKRRIGLEDDGGEATYAVGESTKLFLSGAAAAVALVFFWRMAKPASRNST